MKIGILGSGRIGGNAGRLFARAGQDVLFSLSRDPGKLQRLAAGIGQGARTGTPREAVEFGQVLMLSVPSDLVDEALALAGFIDTTNQFGRDGLVALPAGTTAAQLNQQRANGARLVKAYNTLTAGFQAEAAGRTGPDRVVMFYVADDREAGETLARLIEDSGFAPVSLGGLADAAPMEAPRRPGAVYGEEYNEETGRAFVEALRAR